MPGDPKRCEVDERVGASRNVMETLTHAKLISDCASVHLGACSGRANPVGVAALPYRATSLLTFFRLWASSGSKHIRFSISLLFSLDYRDTLAEEEPTI